MNGTVTTMARQYGRTYCSIWGDPEWLALDPEPKVLYHLLTTSPDISPCGLHTVALNRWALCVAPDSDADRVRDALGVLVRARFVLTDWETDEALVRTFVRYDGRWANPKLRVTVERAVEQVRSSFLRTAVNLEVARLSSEPVDNALAEATEIAKPLHERRNDRQSDRRPDGDPDSNRNQKPETLNQKPEARSPKPEPPNRLRKLIVEQACDTAERQKLEAGDPVRNPARFRSAVADSFEQTHRRALDHLLERVVYEPDNEHAVAGAVLGYLLDGNATALRGWLP